MGLEVGPCATEATRQPGEGGGGGDAADPVPVPVGGVSRRGAQEGVRSGGSRDVHHGAGAGVGAAGGGGVGHALLPHHPHAA
eukprot:707828-Pyramimonas_sp.AAC.1